jgi:hypothetical protein
MKLHPNMVAKAISAPANKQKVLELTGKLAVPVVVDGKWMASGFDEAEFDKHFALDK